MLNVASGLGCVCVSASRVCSHVRVRTVDLSRRVSVGTPVEQKPSDLEVAAFRRGDEAGDPVLYGQAMREGPGG
jgi:hypothetical protein